MTTSGSVNYSQNRTEIILDALQLLNVYGVGRTVSSEDMIFANSLLNKMIKAWQGKGINLWTMDEGILFVTQNVGTYDLADSSVHCARLVNSVVTQLNGAQSAAATSLTVDTTEGMTASDTIGVVLDSGSINWTTIDSVDSSTTLTLSTGLVSAASDRANIYSYSSLINKPLKIHNCRRVLGVDNATTNAMSQEIPMQSISQEDYDVMPLKGANGAPNDYSYSPKIDVTTLNLWPRPNSANYYFKFRYSRMVEDFDNSTDSADFPSEWLEAITWQLALRLAPAFGKADLVTSLLAPMAGTMLQDMLDYDQEVTSISLSPNFES